MTQPSHRQRVFRGEVSSEHLVQLFDDTESLAHTVAEFLLEGWAQGQTLLVVARPEEWALTSNRLIGLGCRPEAMWNELGAQCSFTVLCGLPRQRATGTSSMASRADVPRQPL